MINIYMDLAGGFYMDAFIKEENGNVEVVGFGSVGLNVWRIERDKLNEILKGMEEKVNKEFGLNINDIEDLPWILLEYCYDEFENYYEFHTSFEEYEGEYDDEYDFYSLSNKQKMDIMSRL